MTGDNKRVVERVTDVDLENTRLWLHFPFLFRTGPNQHGRRVSDLYTTCLSSSAYILSTTLSSLLPQPTSSTQQDLTRSQISPFLLPPHPSRASVMTNMSTTSYTPRHSRTTSPPLSVATPSTVGPQTQRLNVVTRLTVEGNAKRAESVPIKMYMKVCRPLSTTPAHLMYLCHEARSSCGQHCSWERDSALQRLAPSLSIVAQC